MDERRRALILLEQTTWDGEDEDRMARLRAWQYYPALREALESLRVDALYKSPVHGSGHINRVLVMAGLISMGEGLSESLLRQYFAACSYHDVGRTFDGLDLEHGTQSALQLAQLTPYQGDALRQLQAAVAAHSQPDVRMDEMIASFAPRDSKRARKLACLLKDADNLDRVRLGDLKPEFLRHKAAKQLADFAGRLLQKDQALKCAYGS